MCKTLLVIRITRDSQDQPFSAILSFWLLSREICRDDHFMRHRPRNESSLRSRRVRMKKGAKKKTKKKKTGNDTV